MEWNGMKYMREKNETNLYAMKTKSCRKWKSLETEIETVKKSLTLFVYATYVNLILRQIVDSNLLQQRFQLRCFK